MRGVGAKYCAKVAAATGKPTAAAGTSANSFRHDKSQQATRPWPRALPILKEQSNGARSVSLKNSATSGLHESLKSSHATTTSCGVDPAHFEPLGTWSADKLAASRAAHPYLMTWIPGQERHRFPILTHGEGIYVYDVHGQKYLDWTSQAFCSNYGHTLPETVVQAATQQLQTLPFTYGGVGITEVRVRLNQLLAELLPATLRPAVYPSSGAEANEAAILLARRYTGRHKILSWYRSYHGATANAGGATGDFRRWYAGGDGTGFVKAFSPFPLYSQPGGPHGSEEERAQAALALLEEQILNEGPEQIASIIVEPIIGAGGCLIMPEGYLQGVRALCDEYGILLHVDEVLVGFGRTGQLFGFQHYKGVVPDIVVAGKGMTGAILPLSLVACRADILQPFDEQPLGWGATYQAHPVALAAAYETLKHFFVTNDVIGGVQRLAPQFEACMQQLAQKHACIKQYRAVGLLGCFDIQNTDGSNPKPMQHKPPTNIQAFEAYRRAYTQAGLVGLHRYPHIHSSPPLIITPDELQDGFGRLDQAISVLNREIGYK